MNYLKDKEEFTDEGHMDNKLFIGDNLLVMRSLRDQSVDVVFTDPPYLTNNSKLTYSDKMTEKDWVEFMRSRVLECHRLLKETGTLLLHIDQRMFVELHQIVYEIFAKKNMITTFCWKRRSSASAQSKFITQEHEYIIACAKNIKKCRWNGIPNEYDQPDITTEFKIVGPKGRDKITPNQQYPLYVDDKGEHQVQGFNKISQNNGAATRTNQQYPLYINEDETGVYKDQQFSVFGGIVGSKDHKLNKFDIIGDNPNPQTSQIYPIYAEENNDKLYEFKERGNGKGPNQTYPIFAAENGDRLEGFKQHKNDGENTIRPNQTYPIYTDAKGERIFQDEIGEYKEQRSFCILGTNGDIRPNQTYPIYAFPEPKPHFTIKTDGYKGEYYDHPFELSQPEEHNKAHSYPINVSQHRISLTPFPGSTKILPMNGTKLGCWRAIPKTAQKFINADMLVVKKNKKGEFKIYQKQYAHWQFDKKLEKLSPIIRTTPIRSIILEPTNRASNAEIKAIYGETAFTFAKPLELIKKLLLIVSNPGEIILDIFAGSGTTGQACYELGRVFILVQLDEAGIPKLTIERLNKTIGNNSYELITNE